MSALVGLSQGCYHRTHSKKIEREYLYRRIDRNTLSGLQLHSTFLDTWNIQAPAKKRIHISEHRCLLDGILHVRKNSRIAREILVYVSLSFPRINIQCLGETKHRHPIYEAKVDGLCTASILWRHLRSTAPFSYFQQAQSTILHARKDWVTNESPDTATYAIAQMINVNVMYNIGAGIACMSWALHSTSGKTWSTGAPLQNTSAAVAAWTSCKNHPFSRTDQSAQMTKPRRKTFTVALYSQLLRIFLIHCSQFTARTATLFVHAYPSPRISMLTRLRSQGIGGISHSRNTLDASSCLH